MRSRLHLVPITGIEVPDADAADVYFSLRQIGSR
jgi:hypothetical protein